MVPHHGGRIPGSSDGGLFREAGRLGGPDHHGRRRYRSLPRHVPPGSEAGKVRLLLKLCGDFSPLGYPVLRRIKEPLLPQTDSGKHLHDEGIPQTSLQHAGGYPEEPGGIPLRSAEGCGADHHPGHLRLHRRAETAVLYGKGPSAHGGFL